MKHCDKCDMDVRGADILCPLCQRRLTGNDVPGAFPVIPTVFRQFRTFFRILLLCTVSGGIVCCTINLLLPNTGHWSLLVLLGIACFWAALTTVIRKRRNLFKTITMQVVVLSLISVLWDIVTVWHGWSVDFFIPITCSAGLFTMAMVATVRRAPPGDYIVYLVTSVFFGIVPLILYVTGLLSVALPSILCIASSVMTLVALVILEGKNMHTEIIRRFHL